MAASSDDLGYLVETWAKDGGRWTVRGSDDGQGHTDSGRRMAVVPEADTPARRAVRLHEAVHAAVGEQRLGSDLGEALEEMRIDALAHRDGVDTSARLDEYNLSDLDMPQLARDQAGGWLQVASSACTAASLAAGHPEVRPDAPEDLRRRFETLDAALSEAQRRALAAAAETLYRSPSASTRQLLERQLEAAFSLPGQQHSGRGGDQQEMAAGAAPGDAANAAEQGGAGTDIGSQASPATATPAGVARPGESASAESPEGSGNTAESDRPGAGAPPQRPAAETAPGGQPGGGDAGSSATASAPPSSGVPGSDSAAEAQPAGGLGASAAPGSGTTTRGSGSGAPAAAAPDAAGADAGEISPATGGAAPAPAGPGDESGPSDGATDTAQLGMPGRGEVHGHSPVTTNGSRTTGDLQQETPPARGAVRHRVVPVGCVGQRTITEILGEDGAWHAQGTPAEKQARLQRAPGRALDRGRRPQGELALRQGQGIGGSSSFIGRMEIDVHTDRTHASKAVRRPGGATSMGQVPEVMERWAEDRQVFRSRRPGGTILIDCSGSMSWNWDALRAAMRDFPAMTIAAYSGQDGHGRLCVLAKDGRWADLNPSHMRGGNEVDLEALTWLGMQPGPRVWLSDGAIVGGRVSEMGGTAAAAAAATIARRRRIVRADTIDAALGYLRTGGTRARAGTHVPAARDFTTPW